ncbi:Protein bric-a-brac 2 [Nymphon striatum]|nr:Protein bric-a-brac 2 [Nymphon striatum]
MVSQQFCLKWNNHQGNLINVFDNLLGKESLVDVTLGCEGASIKAHKIVLSACSPFFEELFQNNPCKHPIVILKDLKYDDMKTIVQFMYKGEVNVTQDRLSTLLKTAENLKIKGLTEFGNDNQSPKESSAPAAIPERPNSPPSSRHGRPKRKKNSHESDPMVIAESPLNQNSNRSPQAPSTSTSTSTQPAFTSDEHMEFNVPKTTFDDNYGHSFSASMHESSNPSSEMLTDTLGNPSQMTSNVNSSQGTSYNEVPSECSICHKRFKYRTNMLNHFNHKHKNGEKVLKCPLCDQLFKWKSQLSNHLDSFHRVVKEFQCGTYLMVRKESIACPVCNKMFQYLSTMKHHYKHKHTKSERISCNICNRSFVWSNDLTKHMNLVHRIPKEFQCCICEKFYHSSGKIVQHHNLVHPHEELSYRRRSRKTEVTSCPVCNKVFLHRSSMRNHYLHKHCEKKEICCEICNMKFGWKNELYRHMDNVHNIPKDFQCSICGRFYPFIRKSFASP